MNARAETLAASPNEVEAALASDTAFRTWYDRTLPRVFSYLLGRLGDRDLAEELTQQTYIAAVDARWQFDGRSDSVTWLCSIARHKLADHFRRLDREERRSRQVLVREIAVGGTDAWRQVDDRDAIRVALRRLPAAQQAVLLFIGLDGLGVPEAARLLGRSRSATQSLLFRARAAFQAAYGHEVSDD